MSNGSNPVTTIGHAEPLRERRVLAGAHHAAHVTGGQERLHPAARGLCMIASIAGGTRTCETSMLKFVTPSRLAW